MALDERDERLSVLASRWQAGDAAAFEEIYRLTVRAVEGYLSRWCAPPDVADLAQEAYLRLIDARRTYRPGMPFRPWLFAIVRHAALDAERARRRRASHEIVSDSPIEGATSHRAEEHLDGLKLAALIEHLPPDQREVVWLARVEGMTSSEIGRIVGATPGAVKVRLHRATARLKSLFHGADAVPSEKTG